MKFDKTNFNNTLAVFIGDFSVVKDELELTEIWCGSMDSDKYDVIIVGAGPAGSSCAIRLAQKTDLKVMLVDRGHPIGSKNLSGGVLWGHDLDELLPEWWKEAPIERRIVQKKIGFLNRDSAFVMDWKFGKWQKEPYNGFSVLRARFDKWLAERAEELGVEVYSGINVEGIVKENGKVVGIRQYEDEFYADCVVIADGANSRLTLEAGLRKEMKPKDYLLGVKEVLQLSSEEIERRFNLDSGEGMAAEFVVGNVPEPLRVGGFFYTNKETLSVGVVIQFDTLLEYGSKNTDRNKENTLFSPAIFSKFKTHPFIAKWVEDAERVEYGAHLVPESGYRMMPKLYDSGVLVAGDAAGFVLSNGMVIQGINYAIKSGILAADAITYASKRKDYSRGTLKRYYDLLKQSYILKDLKKFKNVGKITRNPRVYHAYPNAIIGTFEDIMTEEGKPKSRLITTLLKNVRRNKVGLLSLLKDGLGGWNI